jgi:hypothetical protein
MRALGVLLLCAAAVTAADKDFNGRWTIKVEGYTARVWWLEVNGAGTPNPTGKFVGAPGGDLDVIPEMKIANGELRFFMNKRYVRDAKGPTQPRGVYAAKLQDGKLIGEFWVEGRENAPRTKWVGTRAPVITDKDDGAWKPARPVKLFNGKDLSGWLPIIEGKELGWTVENGIMKSIAGANNLKSAEKFWNFDLHVEFRLGPKTNSGIGLRGRYEIQVLEDYGREPNTHTAGALYSRIAPRVNASKPAGEWQTYDIRLIGRTLTVVFNGVKIHDKVEVEGFTAMAHDADEGLPGPISIQGDHGPIEIRDITVTPLVRK